MHMTNGKPNIFFSSTMKSPVGSSLFAKLVEPDSFRGGEPTWKITLVFDDADPEFIAFKEAVAKFSADFSKDCGKPVNADSIFRADKQTGKPSVTFKSKVRLDDAGLPVRIPMVDSAKEAVNDEPWNGDSVRVAFKLGGWSSPFGVGIKPYLSAVQIVARNRRSQGGGFSAVDVFDGAADTVDEIPF